MTELGGGGEPAGRVREFRTAVLRARSVAPLLADIGRFDIEDSLDAAGMVARTRGTSFGGAPFEEPGVAAASSTSIAAVRLSLLLDELSWAGAGSEIGYFQGSPTRVLEDSLRLVVASGLALGARSPSRWILEFHEHLSADAQLRFPDLDPPAFQSELIRAREQLTAAGVVRCARLLQFASPTEFDSELAAVRALAPEIARDPSLSLSQQQADRMTWALSGSDVLFGHPSGLLHSRLLSLAASAGQRRSRLQDALVQLAEQVKLLTDSIERAGSNRLARAVDRLARTYAGTSDDEDGSPLPADAGLELPEQQTAAPAFDGLYDDLNQYPP